MLGGDRQSDPLTILPHAISQQIVSCFAILRFDACGVTVTFILEGAISHNPPDTPSSVPRRPKGRVHILAF